MLVISSTNPWTEALTNCLASLTKPPESHHLTWISTTSKLILTTSTTFLMAWTKILSVVAMMVGALEDTVVLDPKKLIRIQTLRIKASRWMTWLSISRRNLIIPCLITVFTTIACFTGWQWRAAWLTITWIWASGSSISCRRSGISRKYWRFRRVFSWTTLK